MWKLFLQSFHELKLLFNSVSKQFEPSTGKKVGANGLQPPRFVMLLLGLSETQSINPSWWLQPTENLQRHLGALPKGMSIHRGDCVWVCSEWLRLRPRRLPRQSNPQWQQVGKTKSHSSLTIQLLSACQRVKRRGRQTKETPRDTGGKISSGKSWFSLPDRPAAYLSQSIKSDSAHTQRSLTFVQTILVLAQVLNICRSCCQLLFKTRK